MNMQRFLDTKPRTEYLGSPCFDCAENLHPRPRYGRPQGAALVFVLAALALISFLAIAILTLIRSEDRARARRRI